jgi:16S rRNA processing protein RimM
MEFTQIGFTKKTHGVKGELKIAIEEPFEDLFFEADRLFIEVKGSKMPFFIQQIRGEGELIIQFEDIDNKDKALLIQSKPVFMPTAEVPASIEAPDDGLEYGFLEGFAMSDKTIGEVGAIEEVIEMPQQEMAVVTYKGREVLVPLNDNLIVTISEAKKTILVDLPEGLLDL